MSSGSSGRVFARSLSDLDKHTKNLPVVNNDTSLKTYFASSDILLQRADEYRVVRDAERQYIFLMKFVSFITEKLPKHKAYHAPENKQIRAEYMLKCSEALDTLERLKAALKAAYAKKAQEEAAEKERLAKEAAERAQREQAAKEEAARLAAARAKLMEEEVDAEIHPTSTEEDELFARMQRLKMPANNQVAEDATPKPLDDYGDAENIDDPELERELEEKYGSPPTKLALSESKPELKKTEQAQIAEIHKEFDVDLDIVFGPGKVFGGVESIGLEIQANPTLSQSIAAQSGYSLMITPFGSDVLRPELVENAPPLIDLASTYHPTVILPRMPTSEPTVPHLMDLNTVTDPTRQVIAAAQPPPSAPPLEDVPIVPSTPIASAASAPPIDTFVHQHHQHAQPGDPSIAALKVESDGNIIIVPSHPDAPPEYAAPTGSAIFDAAVFGTPDHPAQLPSLQRSPASSVSSSSSSSSSTSSASRASPSMGEMVRERPRPTAPTSSLDNLPSVPTVDPALRIPSSSTSPTTYHQITENVVVLPQMDEARSLSGKLYASDSELDQLQEEFSITKTLRNKQYNPKKDASLVPKQHVASTATCAAPLPIPSAPTSDAAPQAQQPTSHIPPHLQQPRQSSPTSDHHQHQHNHGPHGHHHYPTGAVQQVYQPPPSMPQFAQYGNQPVPIVYSPYQNPQTFANAQQIMYQPQPNAQAAMLPVMYGVPMVFRPSFLNIHGQQTNNPNAQKVLATLGRSKPASGVASGQVTPKSSSSPVSSFGDGVLSSSDEEDGIPSTEPLPIEFKRLMDAKAKPKKPKKPKKRNASGLRSIEIDDPLRRAVFYVISRDETKFTVTHLIVPKQTATTDTCATTHEDEIFEYQMKHDLLTLGWIHTHPSQSCFLSSVDLHTHSSYQGLFPEAIAIVVAPRDQPNFSIFHLTDPGLAVVQSCPLKGFHLHDEIRLYETAEHVSLRWGSNKFKRVDMR